MSSAETIPENSIDTDPKLRIVRDVIGIQEDFSTRVVTEMKKLKIRDKNDIEMHLKTSGQLTLIDHDEILSLHDVAHREPTEVAIYELAEYLTTELPDHFDNEISIKLKPIEIREDRLPGRHPGPEHSFINYGDFRSAYNKKIHKERLIAKTVLCDFFNLSSALVESRDFWNNNIPMGRLAIARVIGKPNVIKINSIFMRPDLLPEELTLGAATVETVNL